MHTKRYLNYAFYFVAVSSTGLLQATTSASAHFAITQYLNTKSDSDLVLIDAGKEDGIGEGELFTAHRPLPNGGSVFNDGVEKEPSYIELGRLKAVAVYPNKSLAKIIRENTDEAKAWFPKYPGIMAGDLVEVTKLEIQTVAQLLPEEVVQYNQIFVDPKGQPLSFELTSDGKKLLKELAKVYADAHISALLIEGHTDDEGPAEANQIESMQRAFTIRQFFISELGFDEKKIIAIGHGEGEASESGYVPGYQERARRIIIKPVNQNL